MESLFVTVVNMSIAASWVIAAILPARLVLRKAPKKYSYALWAAAGFRLCCPVSFKLPVSIFNIPKAGAGTWGNFSFRGGRAMEFLPENIMGGTDAFVNGPAAGAASGEVLGGTSGGAAGVTSGEAFSSGTEVISGGLESGIYSGQFPWQSEEGEIFSIISAASLIWLTVALILIALGVISYIRLKRGTGAALRLEGFKENVWQSDGVSSPFIMGFIRPKIYVPSGLDRETLEYVLAHESCHLRRKNHLIKAFAFLLLSLHWFNPLCWLAFHFISRDMEMSCDEKVLAEGAELSREELKKNYSMALLSFASEKNLHTAGPLAFGETDVKRRIKNVLGWKKPVTRLAIAATVICAVVTVLCVANPEDSAGFPGKGRDLRTVAIIGGTEISAERMEYAIRYNSLLPGSDPVSGGISALKTQIWEKYAVDELTGHGRENALTAIPKKTDSLKEEFGLMTEQQKSEFFGPLGITYDEWTEIYLPEYDAPAAVYHDLYVSAVNPSYDAFDIAAQQVEITDEAFFEKMNREFPQNAAITDGEAYALIGEFEKSAGASDTRLLSRYIYGGGDKVILYVNTRLKDGGRTEGGLYTSRQNEKWSFTRFEPFSDYRSRENTAHTLLTDMDGGENGENGEYTAMKSYYIDRFDFFPEFYSPNTGSIIIEQKGGRIFMAVDMTMMRFTNTGAPEGPHISFTAEMTNPDSPEILQKKLTGGAYYGTDESSLEHSGAYYVIGEDRLCEIAGELYDYVPAHAARQ